MPKETERDPAKHVQEFLDEHGYVLSAQVPPPVPTADGGMVFHPPLIVVSRKV